jgi:Fe-S-cluster containining protein
MARRPTVVFEPNPMTPRLDANGEPSTPALYRPSAAPCPSCPARCCSSRVEVSLPDVARLCHRLAVPFSAAFELVADGMRPFPLAEGPRAAVLRRDPDGYCQYLLRAGGELRCGVHPLRPATCRLYPFTFRVGDQRLGPRHIRCPVPFGLGPKDEAALRRQARSAAEDWARHVAWIDAWAAEPGPRDLASVLAYVVPRALQADGVPEAEAAASPALGRDPPGVRQLRLLVDHGVVRPPRG